MKYCVLGLGYAPIEYEAERAEWMKHGIVFDFAKSLEDAAEKLRRRSCGGRIMCASPFVLTSSPTKSLPV